MLKIKKIAYLLCLFMSINVYSHNSLSIGKFFYTRLVTDVDSVIFIPSFSDLFKHYTKPIAVRHNSLYIQFNAPEYFFISSYGRYIVEENNFKISELLFGCNYKCLEFKIGKVTLLKNMESSKYPQDKLFVEYSLIENPLDTKDLMGVLFNLRIKRITSLNAIAYRMDSKRSNYKAVIISSRNFSSYENKQIDFLTHLGINIRCILPIKFEKEMEVYLKRFLFASFCFNNDFKPFSLTIDHYPKMLNVGFESIIMWKSLSIEFEHLHVFSYMGNRVINISNSTYVSFSVPLKTLFEYNEKIGVVKKKFVNNNALFSCKFSHVRLDPNTAYGIGLNQYGGSKIGVLGSVSVDIARFFEIKFSLSCESYKFCNDDFRVERRNTNKRKYVGSFGFRFTFHF